MTERITTLEAQNDEQLDMLDKILENQAEILEKLDNIGTPGGDYREFSVEA